VPLECNLWPFFTTTNHSEQGVLPCEPGPQTDSGPACYNWRSEAPVHGSPSLATSQKSVETSCQNQLQQLQICKSKIMYYNTLPYNFPILKIKRSLLISNKRFTCRRSLVSILTQNVIVSQGCYWIPSFQTRVVCRHKFKVTKSKVLVLRKKCLHNASMS
jgi:hypothetical protein